MLSVLLTAVSLGLPVAPGAQQVGSKYLLNGRREARRLWSVGEWALDLEPRVLLRDLLAVSD